LTFTRVHAKDVGGSTIVFNEIGEKRNGPKKRYI
jgi:hypothetical protein